jgi:hypothetical protein
LPRQGDDFIKRDSQLISAHQPNEFFSLSIPHRRAKIAVERRYGAIRSKVHDVSGPQSSSTAW